MINRLAEFMKKNGFEVSDNPSSYYKFHEWSVANQADFYKKALEDIEFTWMKGPKEMLHYNKGDPIWKAEWFIGGEANVYNACIEEQINRGLGDELAAICYREDGKTTRMTFREVKERVEKIASHLSADGIKKGERVCIMLPSCEYSYLLFYAIQKIGAVFVPIPTEIMEMSLVKRLEMTLPKIIFTVDRFVYDKKVIEQGKNVLNALKETAIKGYNPKIIEISYLEGGEVRNFDKPGVLDYQSWLNEPLGTSKLAQTATEPMSNSDIMMILFTSGTTGTPKGTLHTYAALIEDMLENAYSSNLNAGDRFMWYTGPGWMMFPWLVMGTNGLGATTVLYDGSPRINGNDTLLNFVKDFNITHLGLSPPLVLNFVESLESTSGLQNHKTLREVRYTSSPLTDTIANRLSKLGYPPNGACGGTDGCFCYCSSNPVTRREGAKMLPGLGMDVHVVVWDDRDEIDAAVNTELTDAGPNNIGQILIKSPFPSMTRGLLKDDSENTKFRSAYFHDKDGKYWFHGDLASFDAHGYLTIHGRADDLLVVHGNKLSPIDVHDAILSSNHEVSDAAAVSFPVREGDGGELMVFVVLGQNNSEITTEERTKLTVRIKNSVKEKVNKFATPHTVFFVRSLPHTFNNKPALRVIRRAFTGQEIGDRSTISNKESIDEILQISRAFREKQ